MFLGKLDIEGNDIKKVSITKMIRRLDSPIEKKELNTNVIPNERSKKPRK